jgi:TPR repeat protein
MRKHAALILVISLLCLPSANPVFGEQFEDAQESMRQGDYATAYRLLKPLADQGNVNAQHEIGILYKFGWGVPGDWAEAIKWFRRSANQGHADSQAYLGIMFRYGEGVPEDWNEAAKWFRRSAEQGNSTAQFSLGLMYYEGRGVPQNYVLAHMWINLSILYMEFRIFREGMVKTRDEVASKMTPAQIAEAQRLASEWKPKKEGE